MSAGWVEFGSNGLHHATTFPSSSPTLLEPHWQISSERINETFRTVKTPTTSGDRCFSETGITYLEGLDLQITRTPWGNYRRFPPTHRYVHCLIVHPFEAESASSLANVPWTAHGAPSLSRTFFRGHVSSMVALNKGKPLKTL